MHVRLESRPPREADVTVVLTGADGAVEGPSAEALPDPLRRAVTAVRPEAGARGGERLRLATDDGWCDVVLVRPASGDADGVRNALLAAAAKGRLAGRVAVCGAWDSTATQAAVEGLLLGAYRFDAYRSAPAADAPTDVTIVAGDRPREELDALAAAVERARSSAAAANWARSLVDTPPADSVPAALARLISDRLDGTAVKVRIWSLAELKAAGFGGIVGVGKGSANEPCLVELTLQAGTGRPVVLCGKGVTFDAGGLSIKNDRTQQWMKADMSGAAAVASAMDAAATAGLAVNAIALLPLVENMPSATALRPGDVLRHPDGRTTEVTNTDAEGRLILADVLAYATTLGPSAVLDVATLTSGLLGGDHWMLFANDDELASDLLTAAAQAGEPGWRMPLLDSMAGPLQSEIADLKNYSFDRPGVDTLSAAAYLRTFVAGLPWAHLDIVGTAFRLAPDHWPVGATGSPTRALLRFLETRADGAAAAPGTEATQS